MVLEESEDVVGRVVSNLTGESVWQDANPDRDGGGVGCSVVLIVLKPGKPDEVDARMFDVSLIEKFDSLEMNVSS